MQKRFALFLILSAAIFLGWQLAIEKFFPGQVKKQPPLSAALPETPAPSPAATAAVSPAAPAPVAPQAQVEARQVKLKTEFWEGTVSNQGAVLTEWTMTRFTDGKSIDPPHGVNLVSAKHSQEIGAPLRLFIPSDRGLEQALNAAAFAVENVPEAEVFIGRGEQKELLLSYSGNGVVARKRLLFNGSGYDFDFQVEVTRDGQPVDVSVVVGPNFGDQGITNYGYYKPAPEVSYAVGTSVKRETPASVKGAEPHRVDAAPVGWASVDDNYFAMALVPGRPAPGIHLINEKRREKVGADEVERNFISVAIPVTGQTSHVYAGPKDPTTLEKMSEKFGLGAGSGNLEDLINYGFLSTMVKPLARVMLRALIALYGFTHNYGWAIVILTVVLNMFFFPLRWKSSVSMKRTAAMQPKMKDLQERMKKLDKNDPRMAELQREQISLMREGNPLMGCLPLLLQMPFFYAVFTILTVAIEVRHAPFFAHIQDLSSPDRYWILPIVMCVTMIVQTALTPTTADPIQKKMGYLMPLIFTGMFFIYAPAGLVLYWMVGNLVGIAQQYVINKLSPRVPPATPSPSPSDKPQADRSPKSQAKGKKSKELLPNPRA